MDTITIEQVEALAAQVEGDESVERGRLLRLIAAYSRILAVREPHLYERRALHHGDEAGHYDSSWPPRQVYSERRGPRLIRVRRWETEDVPTSSGYYHEWRRTTVDPGLYVDRAGTIYGADETGTGRVGQYAAHPGDCGVDCTIEWSVRDRAEMTIDEIREVEEHLRGLAFPAAARAVG